MTQNPLLYELIIGAIIIFLSILSFKKWSFLRVDFILTKYMKFIKDNNLIIVLLVIPFLLGTEIALASPIDNNIANFLIVALSILIAVFYGCISYFVSFDIEKSLKEYKEINEDNITAKMLDDRQKALKSTLKDSKMITTYEIVITTFSLLLCILTFIFNSMDDYIPYINKFISVIIYFFLVHTIINIFILLKRFTILYNI